MKSFVVFFIFCVSSAWGDKDNEVQNELFYVKPGGEVLDFHISKGGITCTFTYQAQGGTHEEWAMSLKQKQNAMDCEVERPGGTSYLFFQSFRLDIKGGKLKDGQAFGAGYKPIDGEFNVDTKKHLISSVSGKFNSQLAKVVATVEPGRQEL